MRAYLWSVGAVAAVVVLYAPLTRDDASAAAPPMVGIEARWAGEDPPGVISCRGPTLSMLVAADHIEIGDSRDNHVVTFAGHDWRRVGELLDERKRGFDEPMGLEIATAAHASIPYHALVTAMTTARAHGYREYLVDESRLLTRNTELDPLSDEHGE